MRLDYKGTLYIKAYGRYVPLSETVEHYENLEKENEQLKQQIEKMKNCHNCKNWTFFSQREIGCKLQVCKWELKK